MSPSKGSASRFAGATVKAPSNTKHVLTPRDAREAGAFPQTPAREALPTYTLSENDIGVAGSFGNSSIWVNTKATCAVERIFSTQLGESLFGSVSVRYAAAGHRLLSKRAGEAVHPDEGYVWLLQEGPASITVHPAYQQRRVKIAASIEVTETVWVPLHDLSDGYPDEPLLYFAIELHNGGAHLQRLRCVGFTRFRGSTPDDIKAVYNPDIAGLVAKNISHPEAVRIFALTVQPTKYEATFDFGRVYDRSHVHGLMNSVEACGDILGALQYDVELDAGQRVKFCFIAGAYAKGEGAAIAAYRGTDHYEAELQRTVEVIRTSLQSSEILTPDRMINEGALWSKVNMRRVMATYPQGPAFTNEPGASSNIVARDAAWFVYGNDHYMPDFSCSLLQKFAALQYANGKIPEYYNALNGSVEDYDLNINDDTPLFILAANHHHRAHGGGEAHLKKLYPSVARAARYIMSQIDDRGLVVCTAKDPRGNVWAIASWRNIIPNYSINGAVTEINAECAAALRAAGHMADNLGLRNDAQIFFDAGQHVRDAMDRHLLNPDNGLYYLNIDADGNVHTDVTSDELFPVMLRVCDEDTGFRIIARLNSPDFWTEAGLRTASRFDPLYDPSAYVGLLGGVWPGLTWWYAFAAARYHPEFMVKALRSSFGHYARNPKLYNTVPGQFSEWFDGESLINRGMRLSPWEPPRFLWAAVEGVCGMMLTNGSPSIYPLVPATWKWVALKQCPYHRGHFTFFAVKQKGEFHIHATCLADTQTECLTYEEDISNGVLCFSDAAAVVALRRRNMISLMVGNVGDQTASVPINLKNILDPQMKYKTRSYDSERDEWEDKATALGLELLSLAISIETNGYRLIEFTEIYV